MTLEQLIARMREQINARIATYNEHTRALNELRGADAPDQPAIDAKSAERAGVEAEIQQLKVRLEGYEAELRDDEAIQRLQSQVTPEERQAGDGVVRDSRVQVTEQRTYRRDLDQRGEGKQFLNDIAGAFVGSWSARERLDAHMREERVERPEVFERAAGTGAFAGYVVPQYLVDLNVGQASPKRPFANLAVHHDLPETGMTAYISRVSTGASVGLQAAEGDSASESDIDDTLVPIAIQTASGAQSVSRQAIERGLGVEQVVWGDLQKKHASRLDATMLNQATNGLTNVATATTYTDASPTAAELYPKILAGISASEGVFLNDAEVDFVLMHPRRWRWLSAAMTTSWPFISSNRVPAQAGAVTEGVGYDRGIRGYLPDGTAVVTDANIAINLGAGTNEDEVYPISPEECHLWEDPKAPMFIRAEQSQSKKLLIDLVLYSYFAYHLNRYPGGHSKIAGTGLVTPVFA